MRKVFLSIMTAGLLGLTLLVSVANAGLTGCPNQYLPQGYAQLLKVNPDGSKDYTLYRWDSDNLPAGSMAVYNSRGQIMARGTTYINLRMPKGAGYWHLDITDVNKCGAFVRWLHSVVLYN